MIKKIMDSFFQPVYRKIDELQNQLRAEQDHTKCEIIRLDRLYNNHEEKTLKEFNNHKEELINYEEKTLKEFNNYKEELINQFDMYEKKIDILEKDLNLLKNDTLKLEEQNYILREEHEKNIASVSRAIMSTKWRLIDYLEEENYDENEVVECILCGHKELKKNLDKIESKCIFGGGKLERYKCKGCGCIFGPSKFRQQGEQELADDYKVHYLGYQENDSTEGEIESFFLLEPSHDGRYLNYGCGKWAGTILKLREEGYDVYGYDPYAADVENEYVISDINVIKKMRFDGIFSHDLLEHLMNPVQEMLFIKGLLKSPACKMAHSTACYEYKFEYTRFHTCFYTGNAVEALCDKANLYVDKYVDDGNYHNFICYLYGVLDERISFIKEMGVTNHNEKNGNF